MSEELTSGQWVTSTAGGKGTDVIPMPTGLDKGQKLALLREAILETVRTEVRTKPIYGGDKAWERIADGMLATFGERLSTGGGVTRETVEAALKAAIQDNVPMADMPLKGTAMAKKAFDRQISRMVDNVVGRLTSQIRR
jgi:hypothetical protein